MKIYIAATFESRDELRPYRDQLWSLGHEVVSSWLDEVKRPQGMSEEEFSAKLAMKDLAEIMSADLLILDNRSENKRGGKNVEWGVALGQWQRKLLWLIGPKRNVFQHLADKCFNSWDEVLREAHKY